MDKWIRDLITQAVGPIRGAVDAVFQRIAVIWSTIVAVGLGLRNAWRYLINSARYKLTQLRNVTQQTYMSLYWLARIRIPQLLNTTVNGIVNWTLRLISDARNAAAAALNAIAQWVRAELAQLRAFATSIATWVRTTVAEIWATLVFVARLVGSLLTDPAHMAEWLFGALINKVLTYVNDNAELLFDLLLQRGIYYAGKVAGRLEEMLARLL